MSWWVYLKDHSLAPVCDYGESREDACPEPCYENVEVDRHSDGGTHVMGGTTDAELNITYNYSGFFYQALDNQKGLKWLDGKTGEEALPRLIAAVDALGTERAQNYWEPTAGNAGAALHRLAVWAKEHPKAIFKVS